MPPAKRPDEKPKLVLDTNIFVSGIISSKNPPGILLRAFRDEKIRLLVSDSVVDEYLRVLCYPKIRKYPGVTEEFIAHIGALLIHQAERIETHSRIDLSPDPDDNKFLELAVDGEAHMVVSGDKTDILALGKIEDIPIVTAAHCVKELKLARP